MIGRMPKRLSPLILTVLLAILASGCGSDSQASDSGTIVDTAAGGQIDFGSLEGTDTVLWFWAPW